MPAPNNPARPSLQARLAEEEAQKAVHDQRTVAAPAPILGEVVANASRGAPPETTLVNPGTPPEGAPVLSLTGWSEDEISAATDGLAEVPRPVRQILCESVAAWRAALIGLRTRKENESTLNPGYNQETLRVIQDGIDKADVLMKVFEDLAGKEQPQES